MNGAAAEKARFPAADHEFLRELRGRKPPVTLDRILRRALRLPARSERRALIYYRSLPAPARLSTDDPFVDDALMAGVMRLRAARPRWEAAWHLRGNIRVASGRHPLVFVNHRLVPGSAGFDTDLNSPIPSIYAHWLSGRPTIHAERAFLLRDRWEKNYWHLFEDFLPRLVMAEALGIDPTIPIVVSADFIEHHGDSLAETPFLKGRSVIVQPRGHALECRELFLLRPAAFARHWTPGVVARIPAEPLAAPVSRHIYCRRAERSWNGRIAENGLQIEEIFQSAGFSVVDPATMTIPQQKAVFEQAEIIAGINGAAFTNAVFRHDKPLTIGALISANWLSTTFPTMAKVFGFGYAGFVVPPADNKRGAPILAPPDTVNRLIERVLDGAARRR